LYKNKNKQPFRMTHDKDKPTPIVSVPRIDQLDPAAQLESTLSHIDVILDVARKELVNKLGQHPDDLTSLNGYITQHTISSREAPLELLARKRDQQIHQYSLLDYTHDSVKALRQNLVYAPSEREVFADAWLYEAHESRPKSVTIIEDAIGDKATQQSQKLYGALRKSVAEYDTTPLVQLLEKDMHLDISHSHTRFTNDIRI